MWNSKVWCYRSFFLLVRIRAGRLRLILPLALFLIDETLEIIGDLLWLAEKVAPVRIGGGHSDCRPERQRPKSGKFMETGLSPGAIVDFGRELLKALRRHGPIHAG